MRIKKAMIYFPNGTTIEFHVDGPVDEGCDMVKDIYMQRGVLVVELISGKAYGYHMDFMVEYA